METWRGRAELGGWVGFMVGRTGISNVSIYVRVFSLAWADDSKKAFRKYPAWRLSLAVSLLRH